MDNEQVLRVVKDPYITEFDGPTYARLKDCDFHNGTIEVKVKSLLLEDAPDFARGFIGVVSAPMKQTTSLNRSISVRRTAGLII